MAAEEYSSHTCNASRYPDSMSPDLLAVVVGQDRYVQASFR